MGRVTGAQLKSTHGHAWVESSVCRFWSGLHQELSQTVNQSAASASASASTFVLLHRSDPAKLPDSFSGDVALEVTTGLRRSLFLRRRLFRNSRVKLHASLEPRKNAPSCPDVSPFSHQNKSINEASRARVSPEHLRRVCARQCTAHLRSPDAFHAGCDWLPKQPITELPRTFLR